MNIYFCGSMTSSQVKMNDYKELIDYLDTYGNVLNKFVGEKIIDYAPNEVYNRDTNNLKKADLLVADVSIASTGVGFEVGYADLLNIKTLIIYDETLPKSSALILGNPSFVVRGYKNLEEAKLIIKEFVEK